MRRALIGAHGAALDLVAAYLSRAGTLEADESGRTPGILAVTAAEGGPNALCLSWRRSGPDSQPYLDVESPGGISPPGAPKTVREPLDSHGSRCSAVSMT